MTVGTHSAGLTAADVTRGAQKPLWLLPQRKGGARARRRCVPSFLLQRTAAVLTDNALLGIDNLHLRRGKRRFDGGQHAGRSQRVSSARGALCRACTARK